MVQELHMHKRRVAPQATPERKKYISREGRYADREDLLATGCANLPTGISSPDQFCKLLARNERRNGGVYEYDIAFPRVFTDYTRLAESVAMAVAGSSPVIWGVHCPNAAREGGKQPHVHALVYPKVPDAISRPDPGQVFKRHNPAQPDRGGWKKSGGGSTRTEVIEKLKAERELVCSIINDHLAAAGFDERVEHRSYAERGISKQPGRHLGPLRVRAQMAARQGSKETAAPA